MTDDAIEIMDQPAPRGRRIILLLALLWLVAAAVLATLAIRAGFRIAPDDLVGMATLAAGLAAPLAALVLVATRYAPHTGHERIGGNVAYLDPSTDESLLVSFRDAQIFDYWASGE